MNIAQVAQSRWRSRSVSLSAPCSRAGVLGIDACPIEGFDMKAMDEELGLRARGLTSSVIVALGYRAAEDFNAKLPPCMSTRLLAIGRPRPAPCSADLIEFDP